MTDVQTIVPAIWTSFEADAGTDSDVYLGIGGREFLLDSPRDDFERGEASNTSLGALSQVKNPAMNDPRKPYKIRTQDLPDFPVYLRLEGTDHWNIVIVFVLVYAGPDANSQSLAAVYSADIIQSHLQSGLWLGPRAGRCLYLRRRSMQILLRDLKAAKMLEAAKPYLTPPKPARRRK